MKVKFPLKSKCSLLSNIYWYCETGPVSKRPMTVISIAEEFTIKLINLCMSHN